MTVAGRLRRTRFLGGDLAATLAEADPPADCPEEDGAGLLLTLAAGLTLTLTPAALALAASVEARVGGV